MNLTIGVDPGNDSAGVSFWLNGKCVHSLTLCPWKGSLWTGFPFVGFPPDTTVDVWVEVPQHGAHKSRGGVHFAAGMIIADLCSALHIRRSRVRKIKPNEWRKGVLGRTDVTKKQAIAAAKAYVKSVSSDDEAEAVLIGAYGELQKGNELR